MRTVDSTCIWNATGVCSWDITGPQQVRCHPAGCRDFEPKTSSADLQAAEREAVDVEN